MIRLLFLSIVIFIPGWTIGAFIFAVGEYYCFGGPWIGFTKIFWIGLVTGTVNTLAILTVCLIKNRH